MPGSWSAAADATRSTHTAGSAPALLTPIDEDRYDLAAQESRPSSRLWNMPWPRHARRDGGRWIVGGHPAAHGNFNHPPLAVIFPGEGPARLRIPKQHRLVTDQILRRQRLAVPPKKRTFLERCRPGRSRTKVDISPAAPGLAFIGTRFHGTRAPRMPASIASTLGFSKFQPALFHISVLSRPGRSSK
jgi:hypothetical protein